MNNNKKGMLTMEIITALAILTMAVIPLLSLHAVNARYTRQLYYKAVISGMMNDRIAILREGGWQEHGLCEKKEINFIGEAAANIPEGRLLLSVRETENRSNLLKITLSYQPPDIRGMRAVKRETFVFVPGQMGPSK